MKKFLLYFHTLKYLKIKQIRYRAYYALRTRWRKWTRFNYDFATPKSFSKTPIRLSPSITNYTTFLGERSFSFLNLEHTFGGEIDWNFNAYGKLWTYNLTYFEYLHQENIDLETGKALIHDFIQNTATIKDGLEPFPTALRIINWVKFLVRHDIQDSKTDQSLYVQTEMLVDNLEYHLLGNHLLENGFALLFAAYYFSDKNFYEKSYAILQPELEEQILADGAHFELSPMYHCLMLYRILDCINLMRNNPNISFQKNRNLEEKLGVSAENMLAWLQKMTFQNGRLPRLNDTAEGIAPTSQQLFGYATQLRLPSSEITLKESGYRKMQSTDYECVVDVGSVGPDYIPGHAHADTFGFVLHAKGQPFIVDTGISTYENDENRHRERRTSAHNTVQLGEVEQSEVWSSFRVARRAKISHLSEAKNTIKATHNGYARIGATHEREFVFDEKNIRIIDRILTKKNIGKRAFLHFHPSVKVSINGDVVQTNLGKITFTGCQNLELTSYSYANGFNNRVAASKIIITFENQELRTQISL